MGAGVGKREHRIVGDHVGVRDDVHVDRARAPVLVPDAVERLLDGVGPLQEGRRGRVVFRSTTALKYAGWLPGSTPHGSVS
uniref:Uncharacterized protein n=1 Tax=Streptomyces avermitilis TaxID=33903 RepID=A0A499W1E2_STRAX|nr:hypothetical protein SAVMC3_53460 [Streptomyces avermitilis]